MTDIHLELCHFPIMIVPLGKRRWDAIRTPREWGAAAVVNEVECRVDLKKCEVLVLGLNPTLTLVRRLQISIGLSTQCPRVPEV